MIFLPLTCSGSLCLACLLTDLFPPLPLSLLLILGRGRLLTDGVHIFLHLSLSLPLTLGPGCLLTDRVHMFVIFLTAPSHVSFVWTQTDCISARVSCPLQIFPGLGAVWLAGLRFCHQ